MSSKFTRGIQVTQIISDPQINLWIFFAFKLLNIRENQANYHMVQTEPIWCAVGFYFQPLSTQQLELLLFFFSAKLCKVAKACKPVTRVYAGGKQAYSTGPRAHRVQKTRGRIRDSSSGTNVCSVTRPLADERMIKIKICFKYTVRVVKKTKQNKQKNWTNTDEVCYSNNMPVQY